MYKSDKISQQYKKRYIQGKQVAVKKANKFLFYIGWHCHSPFVITKSGNKYINSLSLSVLFFFGGYGIFNKVSVSVCAVSAVVFTVIFAIGAVCLGGNTVKNRAENLTVTLFELFLNR